MRRWTRSSESQAPSSTPHPASSPDDPPTGTQPASGDSILERAELLRAAGDVSGAIDLVESQIPDYNPRHVAGLQVALADLYESAGRNDRARELYTEVLASAHPHYAAGAGVALGRLLEAEGRPGADESYERAMLFRTDSAFVGAVALAGLCLDRNDFDAARRPLRFAATSEDPDVAQFATALLAQLVMTDGNVWGTRILLERVVAGPDPRTAEFASSLLAQLDLRPTAEQPAGRLQQ